MDLPILFSDFYSDAFSKFRKKSLEYGHTWKRMPIEDLKEGLYKEIEEFIENEDDETELLDIANYCMMLHTRMKEAPGDDQ